MRKYLLGSVCVGLVIMVCFTPMSTVPFGNTQFMAQMDFLRQVQRDASMYFWDQSNPNNGLIKDSSDSYSPCSVASVGFGLVALCLMEKNGWKSREAVMQRVTRTLRTLRDKVAHERGFFYHFVSMQNGRRIWKSEASSIDTALVIAGAVFAGEYFKNTEIESLAQEIYERVDWPWMMNGREVMSMGYLPESGFLPYYWDTYNEGLLLYALAIGSPTHPIRREAWWSWHRPVTDSMAGPMVYCRTGSLFVYQYAQAFIDFRNLNDGRINYWKNSVKATLANRYFCIQQKAFFKTYDDYVWGLSASLGPDGYKGYGAEPSDGALHDGTVTPCAAAGSMAFTPRLSTKTLWTMYEKYGKKVYGHYGFVDAFNVDRDWWSTSYIGINQGITVMMIENTLEHTVWAYFMKHPAIKRWAEACMTPVVQRKKISPKTARITLPAHKSVAECT